MSSFWKILIMLVLWFLYTMFVYRGCYPCFSEAFCDGCGITATVDAENPPTTAIGKLAPLVFNWGDANPVANADFDAYKSALLAGMTDDNTLNIEGLYFDGEEAPEGFKNMGLARAEKVKEMLIAAGVPADRIRISSRIAAERAGVKDGPFESCEIGWSAPAKRNPLDFKWGDATPYTNDGFDAYKASIVSGMADDNILEITGLYFEGEEGPEGFENMGLARAGKVKEMLLAAGVPEDRIRLRARLVSERDGVRDGYFQSCEFNWMEAEKPRDTVEELDDRIIIRFPFNSVRKDVNKRVDDYLEKLAKRLLQTGEKVILTGHTDNVGDHNSNMTLGLRRAKVVRDILLRRGVKSAQIVTESKGETQPVASNDTEEGRHDNRRTEVRLIKK